MDGKACNIRDRRSEPRIPVPFVQLTAGDGAGEHQCVMLNVSRSGALVQIPKSLQRSSGLQVCFTLPGTGPLDCRARVIWTRNVYEIHTRAGLKFDNCEGGSIEDYIRNQTGRTETFGRTEPRKPAPFIPAIIHDKTGHLKGVILDMSQSGLLVQTDKPLGAGSVVRLAYFLPETGKVVKRHAEVVWQKSLYGDFCNEGLRFVDVREPAKQPAGV